ncbi:DoxX family protein [Streptomyces sp. URMC 124]|uniref:DoxX family protein n=1 Tax=Streptomyces sp. URMC 124 TaxID=3423405 RepID=UPI003F1BE11F
MDVIAGIALAVFLVSVGIAHFLVPGYFRALVPAWLGRPGTFVAVSGAAEIVVGALILTPGGRTVGGWAAAALISTYLTSHLDALCRARPDRPGRLHRPAGAVARLAVNVLYIGWSVAVAVTAT